MPMCGAQVWCPALDFPERTMLLDQSRPICRARCRAVDSAIVQRTGLHTEALRAAGISACRSAGGPIKSVSTGRCSRLARRSTVVVAAAPHVSDRLLLQTVQWFDCAIRRLIGGHAMTRIAKAFQGLVYGVQTRRGVMHRPVPFVQHRLGIQHLCLWEGGLLHCVTVPLG